MAKQESSINYSGTLGDRVGFVRNGVYYERKKTKSYQPGVKSMAAAHVFGQASQLAAAIGRGFKAQWLVHFVQVHQRLTKVLVQVIHGAKTNAKGSHLVHRGHLALLQQLQFNPKCAADKLLALPVVCSVADGQVVVQVGPLVANAFKPGKVGHTLVVQLGYCWLKLSDYSCSYTQAAPILLATGAAFAGGRMALSIPQKGNYLFLALASIYYLDERGVVVMNQGYQAGSFVGAMGFANGRLQVYQANASAKAEVPLVAPAVMSWDSLDEEEK